MKVVLLDKYACHSEDLYWDELEKLGDVTFYERTSHHEIVPRAKEAEAILVTSMTPLDGTTLSQLPHLRYIGLMATGYNSVDVECAKERRITVTNAPSYSSDSVAQTTFALLLDLTNHIHFYNNMTHRGEWTSHHVADYLHHPVIELNGLTMGIIGFGNIGKIVARIAEGFGMKVLVHTRTVPRRRPRRVVFCSLQELLKESDVVSLHCPLTEQNSDLIGAEELALMKPSAFFLNTSRGKLVDENALAEALSTGKIAGAGLDVLAEEPAHPENPLLFAKNCVVTPHIAWTSRVARQRLIQIACENLRAFLAGAPQNVVSRK
ncbi:MAG: D-2-hydroxyacid dehydrogenase [bacterium]